MDPKDKHIDEIVEDIKSLTNEAMKEISVVSKMTPELIEDLKKLDDEIQCKFCQRVVYCGPPCCYDSVYDKYKKQFNEIEWYKKVLSKKDKKINELNNEIKRLKGEDD
jgi:sugar-specific transcriptional regulator TrmB